MCIEICSQITWACAEFRNFGSVNLLHKDRICASAFAAALLTVGALSSVPSATMAQSAEDPYLATMRLGIQAYREQRFQDSERFYKDALTRIGEKDAQSRTADVYNNLSILYDAEGNKSAANDARTKQREFAHDGTSHEQNPSEANFNDEPSERSIPKGDVISQSRHTVFPHPLGSSFARDNAGGSAFSSDLGSNRSQYVHAYNRQNGTHVNSYSRAPAGESVSQYSYAAPGSGIVRAHANFRQTPSVTEVMNSHGGISQSSYYHATPSASYLMRSYQSPLSSPNFTSTSSPMNSYSISPSFGYSHATPSASQSMQSLPGMATSSWYHH